MINDKLYAIRRSVSWGPRLKSDIVDWGEERRGEKGSCHVPQTNFFAKIQCHNVRVLISGNQIARYPGFVRTSVADICIISKTLYEIIQNFDRGAPKVPSLYP